MIPIDVMQAIDILDKLVSKYYKSPALQKFIDSSVIEEFEEIVEDYYIAFDNLGEE